MIKTINNDNSKKAYSILEVAFPAAELRTFNEINEITKKDNVFYLGYFDDGNLVGTVLGWEDEKIIYIENIAVDPSIRGKGYGALFLEEIKKSFPTKEIILEVEVPYDEMSTRRIGFYERNGFILSEYSYDQPQIGDEPNIHPLVLMSFPEKLDDTKYKYFRDGLFKEIYEVAE